MIIYTDGVHIMCRDLSTLHEFAQSVGLRREWFQDHPVHPHYDIITSRMRRKVLFQDSVQFVSARQLVRIYRSWEKYL